jgi:hypothetical protein
MELVQKGDRTKATECFQGCVDITAQMAHEWILVLDIYVGIEES